MQDLAVGGIQGVFSSCSVLKNEWWGQWHFYQHIPYSLLINQIPLKTTSFQVHQTLLPPWIHDKFVLKFHILFRHDTCNLRVGKVPEEESGRESEFYPCKLISYTTFDWIS